jgi:hypothetical protein
MGKFTKRPNKYITDEIEKVHSYFIDSATIRLDRLRLLLPENKVFIENIDHKEDVNEYSLPEYELKFMNEKIRLLYDLGIVDYLRGV